MGRYCHRVLTVAAAVCLAASAARAQGTSADSGAVATQPGGQPGPLRAALQQAIRRRFAHVVRNRFGI